MIRGLLGLLPPEVAPSESPEDGWIAEPTETAVEFARGLLAYLGISVADGEDRIEQTAPGEWHGTAA